MEITENMVGLTFAVAENVMTENAILEHQKGRSALCTYIFSSICVFVLIIYHV